MADSMALAALAKAQQAAKGTIPDSRIAEQLTNAHTDHPDWFNGATEEQAAQIKANVEAVKLLLGKAELSFADIQKLVQTGKASSYFGVGDMITDPWTDISDSTSYNADWHIAHFSDVEHEDGETVPGMFIQWHWATPFAVQFSHERAFLACPDGLAAGTYTIKFAQALGKFTQLSWYFTLEKDVPAGGRLSGFYQGGESASGYKVYSYSADGKTVLETVTPASGESGTVLGTLPYNTRSGNLNSMYEAFYGWNRWKTSAIRQWLNSAAGIGEWWTAQDAWDIAPNQLTSKAGFLSGCSAELINVMQTVKVATYHNTVYDDPAGNTPDITYDKVFLPSLEQMYANPQKSGEGEYWEYWKRAAGIMSPMETGKSNVYQEIKHYAIENHTSAQPVRVRSAARDYIINTWYVSSSGYFYLSSACGAYKCAPACVI